VGQVEHIGDRRASYRVLAGRCEGREPLGRPRHRWVENSENIFKQSDGKASTELPWLTKGTGGGHL
jgi:hypothetical protein